MRDAQYLRAQAEFCLELARQISDHKTVENLQAEAARYHAEAAEIEAGRQPGSPLVKQSQRKPSLFFYPILASGSDLSRQVV